MPTENRSNDADGWIACDDGLHLIQMDKKLSHYGWVFRKVDGGLPYSVREATTHEMAHAQARQHLRIGVAKIAGQAPAPQPHAEPIAWMVGTAIWWTKEEAERDAAATGLPIVGLGPMTDAAEVERLRKALKFYADRDHFAEDIGSDWDSVSGEPPMSCGTRMRLGSSKTALSLAPPWSAGLKQSRFNPPPLALAPAAREHFRSPQLRQAPARHLPIARTCCL